MKKILTLGLAALAVVACEMDFTRSDYMTAENLKQDPSAPLLTTDAIYSNFQDNVAYKGQEGGEDGNYYIRHYYQTTELRGDNVTVSGITSDPFINAYRYTDDPQKKNIYYMWWKAYKIISSANGNLEMIQPGESALNDHLIGENYFFRALGHFHMVTIFAMPYADGRDNLGVPLVTSTTDIVKERATVGEVYDKIVEDLNHAVEFMSRGEDKRVIGNDKSYVSKAAAWALLSRVYLYMGENKKCVDVCDSLMKTPSAALTAGYDFADYPSHTYDHPETIWCVHLPNNHKWSTSDYGGASIASMYLKDGLGWGEHYWSEALIDLFRRYPDDKRFKAYFRLFDPRSQKDIEAEGGTYQPLKNYDEMYAAFPGQRTVVYPVRSQEGVYCTGSACIDCKINDDGSISFQHSEIKDPDAEKPEILYFDHVAYLRIENGRDSVYVVPATDTNFNGEKDKNGEYRVWVRPGPGKATPKKMRNTDTGEWYKESQEDANARYKAAIGRTDNGGFYLRCYNTKFSYQDGKAMLSSPAMLRWGEVVLNRAEANAKLGNDALAIDDVNIIRTRAGIPALTMADITALGYDGSFTGKPLLDFILDERRMELCFEGHRFFDVFRNRLPLDRRYVGYHIWEVIQPGDPRIAMLISQDEINSSGITQNPR